MSYVTRGAQGLAAFADKKYDEAIEKLGIALKENPKQPAWLLAISEAYVKLSPPQLSKALLNAERAYRAAYDRGDRKNMIKAMHLRATTLFRLGKMADSDRCCRWAIDLACGQPAIHEDHAVDVDENGVYKTPDFDQSKTPSFKSDYQSEGTRSHHFRSIVVRKLKEASLDEAALKPAIKKMPDVGFDIINEDGKMAKSEGGVDNEIKEAATFLELQKANFVPENMDTLSSKDILVAIRSKSTIDDVNHWNKFYTEVKEKHSNSIEIMHELNVANSRYWERSQPRLEHFQTGDKITLSIYMKGIDKHLAESDTPCQLLVYPRKLALVNLPGYSEAKQALSIALTHTIYPHKTSWRISAFKVEIVLVSVTRQAIKELKDTRHSGIQPVSCIISELSQPDVIQIPTPVSLGKPSGLSASKMAEFEASFSLTERTIVENDGSTDIPTASNSKKESGSFIPAPLPSTDDSTSMEPKPQGPSYPTSSKSGPKNWDTINLGDGDNENDENNDPNHFFKMLYQRSSPEQRRAMEKSFVESNGTVLSMDWSSVKNKPVEITPPEGVEAKKW